MRRTASEMINELEIRVARLERSSRNKYAWQEGYDSFHKTEMGAVVELLTQPTQQEVNLSSMTTYRGVDTAHLLRNKTLSSRIEGMGASIFGQFDFDTWSFVGYSAKKDMFVIACTGIIGEPDRSTFEPKRGFLVLNVKTTDVEAPVRVKVLRSGYAHRGWGYVNEDHSVLNVMKKLTKNIFL